MMSNIAHVSWMATTIKAEHLMQILADNLEVKSVHIPQGGGHFTLKVRRQAPDADSSRHPVVQHTVD